MSRDLEHEVRWEPAPVALDGLDQSPSFHAVEGGKVPIEHDLLSAEQAHPSGDPLRRNGRLHVRRALSRVGRRPGVHPVRLFWMPGVLRVEAHEDAALDQRDQVTPAQVARADAKEEGEIGGGRPASFLDDVDDERPEDVFARRATERIDPGPERPR